MIGAVVVLVAFWAWREDAQLQLTDGPVLSGLASLGFKGG